MFGNAASFNSLTMISEQSTGMCHSIDIQALEQGIFN